MTTRISIDPITRLEGHGKVEIFLDDAGNVDNVYFQVPELRGFETFCEGHPVEELARITTRICGVCPEAHHMASAKAADAVYGVEIPSAAKKLRELLYSAFYVTDHATHFYILGGPDFIVGPDSDPKVRNILGVIAKVGKETGLKVINTRHRCHQVIKTLGGKTIHPVSSIPGGVSKGLTEEERKEIEGVARDAVEFGKFSLKAFEDIVLANKTYVDMILHDGYCHNTYNMGTVDENNHINFYDGMVRVTDQDGNEFAKFHAEDYLDHIAERVEPWTYLKFPYLKKVGWKGFVDGKDSGVYKTTPLSRCNAADGMATPLAQEEYEKMYDTLGGKPINATLATHWARLVELLYAAERMLELATDPEITSDNIRTIPTKTPREGVGQVEAPRGTLYHHYITDKNGIVEKVNLIVGTTNNNAAICMSLKKAAQTVIKDGNIGQGLLNLVEMGFRAYDPCFGCATHSLPGSMPLIINIHDCEGDILEELKRD
ncbi:Ni/Fe hydrogenase subunit alpha [Candidatus Fermentibacteria bacterium]|nr:MAG: Ni/Fe hydrogenase subunit alpha [Candidatus Fermentibacteria bacterium]